MKARSGGFTLIEVLVSVVILATGMVFILEGMNTAVAALDASVDKARAAVLVREYLAVFEETALNGGDFSVGEEQGAFDAPYQQYRWQTNVSELRIGFESSGNDSVDEADDQGHLYQVNITVWRAGSERSYQLSSYVFVPPAGGSAQEDGYDVP